MSIPETPKIITDASELDLEYIRNFRLMDDDFMSRFFEDNIECTEISEYQDLSLEEVRKLADELAGLVTVYSFGELVRNRF